MKLIYIIIAEQISPPIKPIYIIIVAIIGLLYLWFLIWAIREHRLQTSQERAIKRLKARLDGIVQTEDDIKVSIEIAKKALRRYKNSLEPGSTYYTQLIKQTEERIVELENYLKIK